jgi:hypothetical protein
MQDDDVQTTMAWQEQQVVKFSSEETPATIKIGQLLQQQYEIANFYQPCTVQSAPLDGHNPSNSWRFNGLWKAANPRLAAGCAWRTIPVFNTRWRERYTKLFNGHCTKAILAQ